MSTKPYRPHKHRPRSKSKSAQARDARTLETNWLWHLLAGLWWLVSLRWARVKR